MEYRISAIDNDPGTGKTLFNKTAEFPCIHAAWDEVARLIETTVGWMNISSCTVDGPEICDRDCPPI